MKLAITFVALGVSMTAAGFARAQAADYETTYLTAEAARGAARSDARRRAVGRDRLPTPRASATSRAASECPPSRRPV